MASVYPTYKLELDTKRNAAFAASIDDIYAYCISMRWNNGCQESYTAYAQPSQLTVLLKNDNQEFGYDSLGSEKISNGNFATWSGGNPSSWTVSGEVGTDPEISQVGTSKVHGGGGTGACNIYASSSAATVSIAQTVLTSGKTYKLTFKITAIRKVSYSGSGVQAYCGSTAVTPILQTEGEHTYYFNATSTSFKIQNYAAADVTIDNVSVKEVNLYGPFLKRGTLIRVRATDPTTSTTSVLFIGRITEVRPMAGARSEKKVQITAADLSSNMRDATFNPKLRRDVRVDQAIQDVFDDAVLPVPYKHSYIMLDVPGTCELGVTATLYAHAATTFDAADTTLAYTGDAVPPDGNGMNITTFIKDLIDAEAGGRFFFDSRTGKFVFHRRNRDLLNTTVWASITASEMIDADYAQNDDLVNVCTINMTPREVGGAGTVVWEATNLPKTLQPGEEYKVTAQFRDPDNPDAAISVTDGIVPVNNYDFIAVTPGGTTSYARLPLSIKFNGRSADIYIQNVPNRGARAMTITTLRVRGTPLKAYDSKQIRAINALSQYQNEVAEERITMAAMGDEEFAYQYALYRVNKFGTPLPRFRNIQFMAQHSTTMLTKALTLTIGNRVNVSDSATGHNRDYIVVGEAHEVTVNKEGVKEHRVRWFLKPAERENFLVIGQTGYNIIGTNKLAL